MSQGSATGLGSWNRSFLTFYTVGIESFGALNLVGEFRYAMAEADILFLVFSETDWHVSKIADRPLQARSPIEYQTVIASKQQYS